MFAGFFVRMGGLRNPFDLGTAFIYTAAHPTVRKCQQARKARR
jgi:hypothetical protein